jgi:hypothetical protein
MDFTVFCFYDGKKRHRNVVLEHMTVLNTRKELVANWFEKLHVEHILGRSLTRKEFERIVEKWNDQGCFDEISDLIIEWLTENFAEDET